MQMDGKKKYLWGVKKIAEAIDNTERRTYHWLQTKKLPAKKVGQIWVAEEGELDEALSGE